MISQLSVKDSALMLSHICLMILDGRGDEEMIDSLLKAATHMVNPELTPVLAIVAEGFRSKTRESHIKSSPTTIDPADPIVQSIRDTLNTRLR